MSYYAKMNGKNLKIHGDSRDSTVGADKGWELILRTKLSSGPSKQQQHHGSSQNNCNHLSQPGIRSHNRGRKNTS